MASLLCIFWPPFTFSTPNLAPFLTWNTTSTNLLTGTWESRQVLCRTNWNAVFSLLWLQLRQTKQPHHMLAPATPSISGFTAREMSQLPTRLCWRGHRNPKLRGRRARRLHLLWTPINKGTPPLKSPSYLLFRSKGGWKTINVFLAISVGLSLTPITNILSAS